MFCVNRELVTLLHARGVDVFLVSGGFYSIIEPVAKELGIPYKNIYANRIKFFYDGNYYLHMTIVKVFVMLSSMLVFCFTGTYAGFDETEPTSQQDGKAKVVAYLKNRYQYRYVTMIGDGVTDLEACPPAVSCHPVHN